MQVISALVCGHFIKGQFK